MPPSRSHKSRHIPLPDKPPERTKDWDDLKKRIAFALPRDVRRIQEATKGMSVTSRDSIYTGLSGIAFMQYHLSGMTLSLQNDHLARNNLISAADDHLSRVLRHHPGYHYASNRLSFIESGIGIAALVLIRDSDNDSSRGMDDGCEVLYGRAGLLYALLYLRKAIYGKPQQEIAHLQGLTSEATLASLVDGIMTRGKHGAASLSSSDLQPLPPLMWTWHGKRYLGGAHGVTGILQRLLSCPKSVIENHVFEILSAILWLVDCQDDAGNWPSKYSTQKGSTADNGVVQWCHGAPGMVILLSTALRVLHDQEGMIAVEGIKGKLCHSLQLGANFVYKNGLLRKGVGLCHGMAGSIYALLAVSDVLDTSSDRQFFTKAAHLAFLATLHEDMTSSGEMVVPDHPWSLYEGLAGMCCAWAEVLCRLGSNDPRRSASGFPGYNEFAGG